MNMNFSFQVKESDLLGRIGVIEVNGKRIETPCLLPVIHPVNQHIPIKELSSMGFKAIMTNSYIIYKRMKEKAIESGVHSMLGFDGVIMTDSGGYQALEYGDIEINGLEIADFQSIIGSDLAVTLDRPTGLNLSREHAIETVEYSIKNAIDTINRYRDSRTVWVGPIQGGLFRDLLAKSTKKLLTSGFRYLALGSPTQIMENYHFDKLVEMILAVRCIMPYSVPLHLFGAGHPLTMAISIALGCDTFDSASYILFAKQGRYMSENGVNLIDEMGYLPCNCNVCNSTSLGELKAMDYSDRLWRIAKHNLFVLRKEIDMCKEAIFEGRLWDLIEERASSHPRLFKAFRLIASKDILTLGTPMLKRRGLMIRSELDKQRPELKIASSHLRHAIKAKFKDAILIICDEGVPFNRLSLTSKVRRLIARGIDIYRFHNELLSYPIELEYIYPFTQTIHAFDIDKDAVMRAVNELKKIGYRRVLTYIPREMRDPNIQE